jgi:hypothetical protein
MRVHLYVRACMRVHACPPHVSGHFMRRGERSSLPAERFLQRRIGFDTSARPPAARAGPAAQVNILARMRHPHVVLFMGVTLAPPCIVTEYCARGEGSRCWGLLKVPVSIPASDGVFVEDGAARAGARKESGQGHRLSYVRVAFRAGP